MSNSHASLGKRFLSVLLVLVMVIGMLPTIAFAAGTTQDVTYYKKVDSLTTEGEYLIVAASGTSFYALNSDLTATPVTVDTNNRIDSTAATVWTASPSGSSWQFKSGSNFLAVESSFGGQNLVASSSSSSATLKNAWTLDTSSRLSVSFALSGTKYLNLSGAAWSADSSGSQISFYKKVTENQTLVGTDANGEVWVKTSTVEDPTAKVVPGNKEGEAWAAANTNADWAAQKVLGIWDATPQYDGQDMETVEDDATVRISLADFPGVQAGNQVTVARWNGNDNWGSTDVTVAEDAEGLYVETTIKKAETFVVVGPYTLIGTNEDGKAVWHYGAATPVVTVDADPVPTPDSAFADALNAANEKWGGLDLALYDVVAKYNGTVMKTLEESVDVVLTSVTGVDKDDAVMVAHWDVSSSSFDKLIQANAPADNKVTFKADTFSPFVVISGIGYNNIIIINTTPGCTITGAGMAMNGTDYDFTVTVDPGYDASNLVVTANGNVFTVGGAKYVDNNDGTYTIKAVDDNYTISAIISETPVVTHKVTFMDNGDGVYNLPAAATVVDGTAITAPADPGREGYTFGGWYTDAACTTAWDFATTVTADTILYAKWTKNTTYTVTFKANGTDVYDMPTSLTVAAGEKITAPDAPGREGYTFGGWYKEADCTNAWAFDTDAVNADTNLYAKWTKNATYTVTYDKNVTGVASVTGMPDSISGIAAGSSYIISNAEPSRSSFTFKGWATTAGGTVVYLPGATITVSADVTLYAVWERNTVSVTLPANGTSYSITSSTLTVGGTVSVNEGSAQTFTVTVTAGYDPTTMKVTANGVELSATAVSDNAYTYKFVADVDTTIDVVAPSMLKYTITLPTGDHFTAKFTAPADAANKGSYTFDYGTTTAQFSVQLKDGYTAVVYIDGAAQTAIAKDGTATYELHATDGIKHVCDIRVETAKVETCTVTYTIDGQAYTTRTVDKGTAISSLTGIVVPSKQGYTFGGWYSNAGLTTALGSATGTVDGDMEVYGKWTPVQGTIKYDLNGTGATGTFADQTKFYGQALKLHETAPTREGYTFKGWATTATGAAVYQPGDMYATEIGEDMVTLYAVWEQITFTVTLPSGTGYSISTEQSTTVNYNGSFTFTVKVDRGYASTIPTVKANGTDYTPSALTTAASDGSRSYSITISNITADQVVSVSVTENATYTVTFYTWKTDGDTTAVYLTQQVEDTYKATQPANPVIEGYTFDGWYNVTTGIDFVLGSTGTADKALGTTYNFDDAVTGDLVVVAKMIPITPQVSWTASGDGWTLTVTSATPTGTYSSPYAVTYNTDVTFTVTIADGYDASNMQVGANGVALAPIDITGNVYTYKLTGVKVNTAITVVGVVRKTVTITYNANARDDVSGMPEQQVVKYYLASDYDTITTQTPTRTGYNFLGWSTNSEATTAAYSNPAVTGTSNIANFATDTTLYAIWQAQTVTIGLAVSDVAKTTGSGTATDPYVYYEYEGQEVTLTATLDTAVSTGSINFYKNGTLLISVPANGSSTYTATAVTSAYKLDGTLVEDSYQVEYKAEGDEGYGSTGKTTAEKVAVLSTAITWKLNASNEVDNDGVGTGNYHYTSTIAISGLSAGVAMTAGKTYTLTAPAVYELGTDYATATPLKVGTDYTITWQYLDGANGWKTLAENQTTSTFQVTSEYSKYQFRALMVVNTGVSTVYTKAAKFGTDEGDYKGDLNTTETMNWLISEPTPAVVLQTTTTTLDITGADNEDDDVVINGATPFTTIGDHKAQFEGQTVTLTATVKETSTGTPAVASGSVEFYQNGTLIATVPVETAGDNMGKASCTATMNAFTGTDATAAMDTFYAKYVENATYDDSTSATSDVYIKSTAIQTPVITSAKAGTGNATSTTYDADLTGLLAGVEHTFTLKTTGATTAESANWSVVAKDGRSVDEANYTIKWYAQHVDDDNKVGDTDAGKSFVTTKTMKDDEFYVELIPQNDMKTGATSKKAIIGTKQDVEIEVTASDEITSTTTGNPDVYQLNEITLTATVTAKESDATVKPTGTVAFYYQNGTNWIKLGEAVLDVDTDGEMRASITTTKLPVDAIDNTKRDVTISVTYTGDETFNEITDQADTKITTEEVTVYSSVVYVADNENKASGTVTDGINITANGSLVANEPNVTLTLSDIYTLDHSNATVNGVDLSKLKYGTDYTVQWQKLDNAIQNQDKDASGTVISGSYTTTDKWSNISGETGRSYTISSVVQDAAYRAMITVTGTPITKGSFTEVDQAVAGRKVYYSNVLVVGAGQATVTTNITTSDNTNFNEEGIVEGETVTIHALVAGASNVTPISNLTVTITPKGSSDAVFTDELTTVNGYNAFTWNTTGVTPGYYTLTVEATSNNGYAPQTIERTLIVRDNNYTLTVNVNSKVYNGKAQGIDWSLTGINFQNALAQKSVVVYYYDESGKMVEPTQAGEYTYELYLPASAYWTELDHVTGTFTITPRPVNVVDLVAQAKVYDGTTDINELEVILNDSAVDGNGVATGTTGIINGDSIYATGVMTIDNAGAGERTLSVSDVTLHGDDKDNYVVGNTDYTETINVQRSQVKGDIANSTFQYTGSNITVPASDIILIDQAGNVITPANYTVTYYYHNGDGVEKVDAMNKLGKYTVIARPEQNNYKGGASETIYVVEGAGTDATPTAPTSTLINITNTVELFGAADNRGIVATATNGAATNIVYYVNGVEQNNAPTNAGRYLVKVTSGADAAYGIYTIVKARPEFAPTTNAAEVTYNSAPYSGTVNAGFVADKSDSTAATYITYTGGTIQGIAYEAPTEVGKYIATVHVGETANYTAHEEQVAFEIKPALLTITADDLARWQYSSYPDMVATYTGLATDGVAPDTSLRDVQIQPEFIFNDLNGDGQPEYTNSALDQVGKDYPITVRNALARNYTVTYESGSYAVNELDPKAELAIHGMIDNGTNVENIAYYGDEIQLYAYGNYKSNGDGTGVYNPSSLLNWKVSDPSIATIDAEKGLLTITGVGDFTVTLTRGSGDAAISTSIDIKALPKEVSVNVPDVDKVYNALEQTYDGTVTVEGLINGDADAATLVAGNKRTNVGSQIVTYKVDTTKYVSETYGGLFTINHKEVTVKPDTQTVDYGADLSIAENAYTVTGEVGSPLVSALNTGSTVVASVRELYNNLDVYDGYEILVAGVENPNYNVTYLTKTDAGAEQPEDVKVTAKNLTFKTGVINSDGRTSGYMKSNSLFYKDEGFAITGETFTTTPVDRMYGEVNPVMDYLFDALIAGDSEADLVSMLDWLVEYSDVVKHNIQGDANVKFDKDHHIGGYRSSDYLAGMSPYYIDGMLGTAGVKNYTTTVAAATQNIYQRPVTLSVRPGVTLTAYKPSIIDDSNNVKQDVLKQLLLNNLVVGEYNGKGGLATLLGHTIEDLDIQIDTVSYSGDTITVTIKLGNTNYWTENLNFTVKVDPSKIVANYGPLGWTSATVTMTGVDEHGNSTGLTNVSGNVQYLIFVKDTTVTEHKYSHYKNLTPVRSVTMTYGGSTGYYIANYDRLSAGDYVMFAIAEGYTIIE